jgi:dihydroxyacetone kinase
MPPISWCDERPSHQGRLVSNDDGAAVRIREQNLRLSQLDSAAGDGDHEATMLRVVSCLEGAFSPSKSPDLKSSSYQAGWNALGAGGGASTSLLGTLFLGMSDAVTADSSLLDCALATRT